MTMAVFGTGNVIVPKETEAVVVALQTTLVKLCEHYQVVSRQLSQVPQGHTPQRQLMQHQLSMIQGEIRSVDRKLKEAIKRGAEAISQGTTNNIAGTSSSHNGRKPASKTRSSVSVNPVHPSTQCKKEEFLVFLGLISQEALKLRKLQTGKVERRRRTANTNPKYSSNGFLKLDELSTRRSKRLEAMPSGGSPDLEKLTTPYVHPQPPIQSCYVCYGTDFNLSCETCTTKFHAECIKLTASNAPIPHRLPICPKCVQAANTSQIVRIQNRSSRPPPSIMRSPVKLPGGSYAEDSATQAPSKRARRSNSTTDVEKYRPTRRNHSRSNAKKAASSMTSKLKGTNGGSNSKTSTTTTTTTTSRVTRVRLNMRRSSEEPKSGNVPAAAAKLSETPNASPKRQQSPKQSAIKWPNKLKTKQIRTYARKRFPIQSPANGTHVCTDDPCQLCILSDSTAVSSHEDEENSLLIPHQSDIGIEVSIKTNMDQQIPLVINNNNNVNGIDQLHATAETHSKINTSEAIGNGHRKTKKSFSKRKFASANARSDILDAVTNKLNEVNLQQPKKRKRSVKAKVENAIVMRKTIIAMTAAANTVMSNPMKCASDGEDEWANDSVMQSISSVIAWASEDEYQTDQTCNLDTTTDSMTMLMSPSMIKCELQDDKLDDQDDSEYDPNFVQQTAPDNLPVDAEEIMNEEEDKSNLSCSMKGQISDEDDESETLLSLNSPAPSWADGDVMSRTELVEKMLHVPDTIEQTKLKSVCGVADNS